MENPFRLGQPVRVGGKLGIYVCRQEVSDRHLVQFEAVSGKCDWVPLDKIEAVEPEAEPTRLTYKLGPGGVGWFKASSPSPEPTPGESLLARCPPPIREYLTAMIRYTIGDFDSGTVLTLAEVIANDLADDLRRRGEEVPTRYQPDGGGA